jgi:hypothetical protein
MDKTEAKQDMIHTCLTDTAPITSSFKLPLGHCAPALDYDRGLLWLFYKAKAPKKKERQVEKMASRRQACPWRHCGRNATKSVHRQISTLIKPNKTLWLRTDGVSFSSHDKR